MSELFGKPTILSFAFTGCSSYCSAQTMSLAFLQDELTESLGGNKPMVDKLIEETGAHVVDHSTETFGDVNHSTDVYLFDRHG